MLSTRWERSFLIDLRSTGKDLSRRVGEMFRRNNSWTIKESSFPSSWQKGMDFDKPWWQAKFSPFIGHIWLVLANMLYENLVYRVMWDSHNPNKHGRVIRYCFYPRIIKEKEHCLISPDRQPFIGRIWLFFVKMLYENLVFMVIWDSHNPNKHGRVIKYWFLSKNH